MSIGLPSQNHSMMGSRPLLAVPFHASKPGIGLGRTPIAIDWSIMMLILSKSTDGKNGISELAERTSAILQASLRIEFISQSSKDFRWRSGISISRITTQISNVLLKFRNQISVSRVASLGTVRWRVWRQLDVRCHRPRNETRPSPSRR